MARQAMIIVMSLFSAHEEKVFFRSILPPFFFLHQVVLTLLGQFLLSVDLISNKVPQQSWSHHQDWDFKGLIFATTGICLMSKLCQAGRWFSKEVLKKKRGSSMQRIWKFFCDKKKQYLTFYHSATDILNYIE